MSEGDSGTLSVSPLLTCRLAHTIPNLQNCLGAYSMIARKYLISGLVQGVGYRFFAQRSSAKHQVRGYVRNLADGRVEVLVEGSEKAVEAFKLDLAAGPAYSSVGQIEELVVEPSNLYSTFRIER